MKKYFLYFSVLFIVYSCESQNAIPENSRSLLYKQDGLTIHPQFAIFHQGETFSELDFKINSKELLYSRSDGINFSSNVLISYRLLKYYDSEEIIDSSSSRLIDVNNDNTDKYLVGKINFNAVAPNNYFINVTITDLNRKVSVTKIIEIQKSNDINRQNFILRSVDNDVPLFRNYIKLGETVNIAYKFKMPLYVYVRYYNRDFPLAAPPFSEISPNAFQFKEDSVFIIKSTLDGVINFTAKKKGFYHFQCDSSSREGFTLFSFSETFPDVKKADDMIPPLRYITSKSDYDELIESRNKKDAVGKFWLNNTSNKDRARLLISKFYNRVQETNQYFSSYVEGWKTDRGMIYLIFGSPNIVHRTENSETWVYGEERDVNAVNFSFLKVDNPFTNNDFTLERSAFYKQSWFMSVDIWRQGRSSVTE